MHRQRAPVGTQRPLIQFLQSLRLSCRVSHSPSRHCSECPVYGCAYNPVAIPVDGLTIRVWEQEWRALRPREITPYERDAEIAHKCSYWTIRRTCSTSYEHPRMIDLVPFSPSQGTQVVDADRPAEKLHWYGKQRHGPGVVVVEDVMTHDDHSVCRCRIVRLACCCHRVDQVSMTRRSRGQAGTSLPTPSTICLLKLTARG